MQVVVTYVRSLFCITLLFSDLNNDDLYNYIYIALLYLRFYKIMYNNIIIIIQFDDICITYCYTCTILINHAYEY